MSSSMSHSLISLVSTLSHRKVPMFSVKFLVLGLQELKVSSFTQMNGAYFFL